MNESGATPKKNVIRRIVKWGAICFALCLFLVLAVSAAAWYMLDEEMLKSELSKTLGRSVAFTSISPGLLKISLNELSVGDLPAFESDPLLTAGRLDLRYSIMSIFRGKLVINRVILANAGLGIEQDSAGRTNVDDLKSKDKDGALFEIRELELDGMDLNVKTGGRTVAVTGLRGEILDLASRPNRFDLEGTLFSAPFTAEGFIDQDSMAGRVKLTMSNLAIDQFKIETPEADLSGLVLAVDGELGFSPDTFQWNGEVNAPGLANFSGGLHGIWSDPSAARGNVTISAQAENLSRIRAARQYLADYKLSGGFRVTVPLTGNFADISKNISGELMGLSASPPQIRKSLSDISGTFKVANGVAELGGISLKAGGTPISLSGAVGIEKQTLDITVKTGQADAGDLLGLLPSSPLPEGTAVSGPMSLDVRVRGTASAPDVSGRVELAGFTARMTNPAAEISDIRGAIEFNGETAKFDGIRASFGESPFTLSGTYHLTKAAADLAVAATNIDLAAILALLPESPLPKGMSIAGRSTLEMKIAGPTAAPLVNGWAELLNVSLSLVEPKTDLREITGRVELSGDDIVLKNVKAKMNSMAVAVGGTYDRKTESLNVNVKADNIVLSELPADLGSKTLEMKGAASFDGTVTGRAASPVVKGDIVSEKLELYGVELTNVTAKMTFDSPNLDVASVDAKALGGEISGSAGMNVVSPAMPFKFKLTGSAIDFPRAMATASRLSGQSMSGVTSGRISGSLDLSASNFADKSTFSGNGNAVAEDVDLSSVRVITAISQALMAGQLKSLSGFMNALSSVDFKKAETLRGSFRISNGRIGISETIRLAGANDYTLGFKGSVGLDGSIDGLVADMEFPKSWASGRVGELVVAALGGNLTGAKGTIPLGFAGSFSSPSIKLAKGDVGSALLNAGMGFLTGQDGAQNGSTQQPEPPPESTGPVSAESKALEKPRGEAAPTEPAPPQKPEERVINILGDLIRRR